MKISFTLNGKEVTVESPPYARFIHILRERFGLLGTKEGCLQGKCGFCFIFLNAELVPACMLPVFSAFRGNVTTIEGFRSTPEFSDIEKGFLQAGANPCGFCSSAKILTTHKLLEENPSPSEAQIRKALSGIICRCTSYSCLVEGVKAAALNRRQRDHGSR
ncbi:MAG: 2Fe-2S iron-sulfur cluster binding domain-containing protein [Spirochaetales bacterium]|jgi:carbon-monoxide dehydrogenase small subunit|nr:2Fe-2S iron-sulfur cluster binding domain-containing protein [Spirochaetales bacterium]